jgi:hypothetical protein
MRIRWIALRVLLIAVSACSRNLQGASPAQAPSAPTTAAHGVPADQGFWATDGWRSAAPAEQGMGGAKLDAALAWAEHRKLALHRVLVIRHG